MLLFFFLLTEGAFHATSNLVLYLRTRFIQHIHMTNTYNQSSPNKMGIVSRNILEQSYAHPGHCYGHTLWSGKPHPNGGIALRFGRRHGHRFAGSRGSVLFLLLIK